MRNLNKKKNITIPVFDIASLVSGFYIGYNEGKGVDMSAFTEYAFKIGPTILGTGLNQMILRTSNFLNFAITYNMVNKFKQGKSSIDYKDIKNKTINELEEDEREEIKEMLSKKLKNTYEKVENFNYKKRAVKNATMFAAETGIGYLAGRLYSQMG